MDKQTSDALKGCETLKRKLRVATEALTGLARGGCVFGTGLAACVLPSDGEPICHRCLAAAALAEIEREG